MTGYVLFAHGSRMEEANASVYRVARDFAAQTGERAVEVAFLELAKPELGDAVGALAGRGIQKIIVVPYFLTLGVHLQRDLPGIVADLKEAHPGLEIAVTPPLDGHPALLNAVVDRAMRS